MFFCITCSTVEKNRRFSFKIVENIKSQKFKNALSIAEDKDFYTKKNNLLLKKLELGTIHYLNNNFYQSLKYFEEAKKISDDLYVVSISKKLSSIWDANLDNYYGEKYERSMIRFYLSLINYHLYQQGFYEEYTDVNGIKVNKKELSEKEKMFHLTYARSVIVEWDTLLKTIQNETNNIPIYKNDMLAKLWGSFIHSEYGSLGDKQISIKLYEDAEKLLLTNYNMYSVFNKKYKKFNKDFKKLPNKSLYDLNQNYIEDTEFSFELKNFIQNKKNKLQKHINDNLVILFKDNLIAQKVAVPISVPLFLTAQDKKKEHTFIRFPATIKIEFPQIVDDININHFIVKLYKNNTEITHNKLILVQPLSDIAKKTLDDENLLLRSKIIARISAKYVAAVVAANILYKQSGGEDSSLARVIATASYLSSIQIINKTSQADIRYWSTLFSNAYLTTLSLDSGNYTLKVFNQNKLVYKKDITINKNKITFIDINNF